MSQIFPETVALLNKCQADYEAEMRARGRTPLARYVDEEGNALPDPHAGVAPAAEATAVQRAAKPRKEGVLKATSKAEQAREIMRSTKDSGLPLESIIQMIMDATGHDKALAKATYKANAARVGIVL